MYAQRDNYQQRQQTIPNVGIYVRVSREDEVNDESSSESIVNQKEFLMRYAVEQGWNVIEIFSDDGYTGTNFDRPDFKRLVKAIEERKVNLVLTKDLSRLGRDYIDTGYYIERYFPAQNVRYIAVNDGIDTFEQNSSNNDMSPFKSVMNDLYAKDISKKVKTNITVKMRKGQYIGSFAPYGYLKSPDDKNRLIIDPQIAPIIRQIFEMYVSGAGYARIAHALNDQGVPCPSVYKAQAGKYVNGKIRVFRWGLNTVRYIITNPVYVGDTAQHKFQHISYKVKRLKGVPRSQWITVEDTHEPLIDRETFRQAQQLTLLKNGTYDNTPNGNHLLRGLIYCKDCGERMTYTKTQKGEWYCICSNYKRFKQCSRHSYPERELNQCVLDGLRKLASAAVDGEELLKDARQEASRRPQKANLAEKQLEAADKRLEEIQKIIKALYEDKVKGVITERDFLDLSQGYNKEREDLGAKMSKLVKRKPQDTLEPFDAKILGIVKGLLEFTDLPKTALAQLIKRIEISEDKQIAVYYTFSPPSCIPK